MQTAKDIVDALGGTVAVANALGLPPSTVSSWKGSGSIPKWRLDGIRAFAKKRGVALDLTPTTPSEAA